MSTNQRGCMTLLIALGVMVVACGIIPLWLLPTQFGTATTLPVITVPPEYYREDWPGLPFPGFEEFVNTQGGALLATVIVLLIAVQASRASKGWTQEVPGRFQAFVEVLVGGLWGLTKNQAGTKPKVKNILFPVVGSIFLYLLAANWGKLLPGVESVGVLHCAVYEPVTFNGHPIHETSFLGATTFSLRVEQILFVGTPATEKGYKQCKEFLQYGHYPEYRVKELDPFLDQRVVHTTAEGDTLANIAEAYMAQVEATTAGALPEPGQPGNSLYAPWEYEGWKEVSISPSSIVLLNVSGSETTIQAAGADDHGGEAAEGEAAEGETAEAAIFEGAAPVELHGLTATTPLAAGQQIVIREELLGEAATTVHNQLYTVAPFVRGLATDLNLTLGLAIMSFLLIQAFGISELGLDYFQKFVNVRAIGGLGQRPLGAIDFVAGLFEIISELGKIVSLSFRLFGAIFAGSILFAVFLFLFGTIAPGVILLLEIIVGGAQAAVFAILTLIFVAQAMVSHHHDDEHGEHAESH